MFAVARMLKFRLQAPASCRSAVRSAAPSICHATQLSSLTRRGRMMSSMYPTLAAWKGLLNFSSYSASRRLMSSPSPLQEREPAARF